MVILTSNLNFVDKINIFMIFIDPENVYLDTKIVVLSDIEAGISISVAIMRVIMSAN